MANTTNFGWETPDDTDLVKDGAAAMRTLGNAIDASFVDLKGGTTGQVLSKTSNTDLDFTWVTSDDANAIQNAIVDAKGDLITATAADTPARLAVGSNGETLVADSAATTGLRWQGNYAAGKNAIINGDFRIWQRGTSFSYGGAYTFSADRWQGYGYSGTQTVSQQTFTPGTAPVAGYEGAFFARVTCTNTTNYFLTRIEDVRTYAGQTVTLSFWAKSASNQTLASVSVVQNFGSGGSGSVTAVNNTSTAVTTSWARYSVTFSMPSISGKTIGTSSYVQVELQGAINNALDLWGFQLEIGNTATAFQTATGTLQGELAACQRYYQTGGATGVGFSGNVTNGSVYYYTYVYPVQLRVSSSVSLTNANNSNFSSSTGSTFLSNSSFTEYRTANGTGQGLFGSTFVVSAEL